MPEIPEGAPRQPAGSFALVLHAHLPYVRHAPGEHTLESRWLYEAITETYLPLLEVFDNLVRDGVPCRATIGLTPPLCAMLTDPALQEGYVQHVRLSRELAEREVERTGREAPEFGDLAHFYLDLFERSLKRFEGYRRNLVDAFGRLQSQGALEIMASAATHGFLPLMEGAPGAAAAQIRLGVDDYRSRFGCDPQGFWLPECGFRPGDDRVLAECGVRYVILDTHGLLHAQPRPLDANYAPVYTPAGVAAFGRDEDTSKQVWSADEGYPGDPSYREFYRDIGYDLPWEQVAPYLGTDFRHQTGIKYHRITGRGGDPGVHHTDHKERYDLKTAIDRAAEHAGNFMFNRERQIEWLAGHAHRPPVVVAPYDAELFGHWWFEGPRFLDFFMRKSAYDQNVYRLVTPGDYLDRNPSLQMAVPSPSSWGYKGYNEVWLEASNAWLYRHLHHAARRMRELAERHPDAVGERKRALDQAAREVCLAQSSDWAFIMKTGTVVDYARFRTELHLARFAELAAMVEQDVIDVERLKRFETEDAVLPACDYRAYTAEAGRLQRV